MGKGAKWLIIWGLCSCSLIVQAQQRQPGDIQTEFDVVWGFGQGDFGDNLDRPMMGLVFSFGGRTPDLPLVLSTEIGWLSYRFDNHLELQRPSGGTPLISVVNVATKNSIMLTHAVARLVPYQGVLTPYVGGLIGFKYLSTGIHLESEALFDEDGELLIDDDDRILISARYNSFSLSYGLETGINLRIFQGRLGLQHPNSTISLHAGVQYLFGSKTDYLTENSILIQADRIGFEQVESDTNILIPKLGFRVGI